MTIISIAVGCLFPYFNFTINGFDRAIRYTQIHEHIVDIRLVFLK